MKRILYISALLTAAACTGTMTENPYEEDLNVLTVSISYPKGFEAEERLGAEILIEDINKEGAYRGVTGSEGCAEFRLPDGLYRINVSRKDDKGIFNGSADKVVMAGEDRAIDLALAFSKTGSIVIKELYCGGCKKLPQEGNYQSDQYFILHNNDFNVQYLDSLCFGTLSPYNATGSNAFISKDPVTGETIYPDFLPVIQAVWQIPGDGDDFPLHPGEDAVICLRGAIDHTQQYPLSVNLNRPDYFVCYNITYFTNTTYHPAPGDLISSDRIIDVVVKTGKANAYSMSISSPTLVVWKPEGMSMHEYVALEGNIIPVPGSVDDQVVKVPYGWVVDAVEVFDGRSSSNSKRIAPSADAGYVTQTDVFLGRSLIRHTDTQASQAAGYEVLMDTNNSLNDFYESSRQSLNE